MDELLAVCRIYKEELRNIPPCEMISGAHNHNAGSIALDTNICACRMSKRLV